MSFCFQFQALQVAVVVKTPSANAEDIRCGFNSWDKKIPLSKKSQYTPVLLPGNFHDRGAWWATVHGAHKESDTTE